MSLDDSRIEQLKKKLYSQTEKDSVPHRVRLHPHSSLASKGWQGDTEDQNPVMGFDDARERVGYGSNNRLMKGLVIGAFMFFILAVAVAAYIFLAGSNVVSPNNIDIQMSGPVASPAGEELSLDIDIHNKNPSELQLADLVITYPEGSRRANDKISPLITDRISIGTIGAGKNVRKTIKSILFGEENVKKEIKVTLEYRVPGSSSIFVKDKIYPIFIGNSPVTLTVDTLKEITADQQAQFKITLVSNSTSIIKGLLLKVDYPFGFQYASGIPAPASGNDTWSLGDLEPGGKREITLIGKIVGGNNEERVFNFSTGTQDPNNSTSIKTVFVTSSASVSVKKPFLAADISLNGDGSNVVAVDAGDDVKGEVTWQNNLDVPVNDVVIQAHITGSMLDKTTVVGDRGFYRSIDSTIIWDKTTLPDLAEVTPGGLGRIQFSLASLPPNTPNNSSFRRPALTIDLSIKAKRLNENRVPEDIASTISRQLKIQSGLVMKTRIVRNVGPFQNTGPLPPIADKESTYTVIVNVSNSFNTVKNVVFTTTLPTYVKWLGVVNPANSNALYSADKHQVTWTLGDIAPGTGYDASAKEFAFQVSLLPSISQVGSAPTVVNAQRIAGQDAYTNTTIQDTEQLLDTQISTDPTFVYGQDKVQR